MLARTLLVVTFTIAIVLPSTSQVSIIPEPVSLQQKEGVYNLKTQIVIEEGSTNLAVKKIADWLKSNKLSLNLSRTIVTFFSVHIGKKFRPYRA